MCVHTATSRHRLKLVSVLWKPCVTIATSGTRSVTAAAVYEVVPFTTEKLRSVMKNPEFLSLP